MKEIKLWIPGIARPAGSHKTFQGRIVHASKYTKEWMDTISWFALQEYGRQILWEGPIHLDVVVYLPRPKNHYYTGINAGTIKESAPLEHIKKPDLDKLVRAVQDALTKIIWRDDSQVIIIHALKHYENLFQKPGVEIYIKEVERE